MWAESDENSLPQSYPDLIHELDVAPIHEKIRLEKEMAARKQLWKARSPFEPLFLKVLISDSSLIKNKNFFQFLKDKMNLTVDHGILNMCLDTSAAVSPFAIAEVHTHNTVYIQYCLVLYSTMIQYIYFYT